MACWLQVVGLLVSPVPCPRFCIAARLGLYLAVGAGERPAARVSADRTALYKYVQWVIFHDGEQGLRAYSTRPLNQRASLWNAQSRCQTGQSSGTASASVVVVNPNFAFAEQDLGRGKVPNGAQLIKQLRGGDSLRERYALWIVHVVRSQCFARIRGFAWLYDTQ